MTLECTHGTITLADGRSLGYCQCGDPDGKPLFYFHGFPGSRLEVEFAAQMGAVNGLRFIGVDRPGFGLSEFQPERTLLHWPADVAQLARHMQIKQFAVIGVSGGAPYALACAHLLPDLVTVAGVVGGVGPLQQASCLKDMQFSYRTGLYISTRWPSLIPLFFALPARLFKSAPDLMLENLASRAGEPDKNILLNSTLNSLMKRNMVEAVRSGSRGAVSDLKILTESWGFDLKRICVPVRLWHGERDRIVPSSFSRSMAEQLFDCRAVFFREEGHFSIIANRMDEMLQDLSYPLL